ncbi:hypothetical protein AB0C04_05815 [Micromonospora sp. NPDC048909]|uniref:hypothetical protein n=1 Tax=Micromonospora sp. NPDC048909 TaxID=3155643 RepID=UPI0033EB7D32
MGQTTAEQSPPRRPDARAAVLVTLGWYAVLIAAGFGGAALLSGAVPAGCGDECTSERDGWLLFGLYTVTPALFVAMLVSLVLLRLTATRLRSALAAGTLSAVPLLLLAGGLAALILR